MVRKDEIEGIRKLDGKLLNGSENQEANGTEKVNLDEIYFTRTRIIDVSCGSKSCLHSKDGRSSEYSILRKLEEC